MEILWSAFLTVIVNIQYLLNAYCSLRSVRMVYFHSDFGIIAHTWQLNANHRANFFAQFLGWLHASLKAHPKLSAE